MIIHNQALTIIYSTFVKKTKQNFFVVCAPRL